MRFATLSTLLFALPLNEALAQVANPPRESYDMQCGIPKVKDAIFADCETLFNDESKWALGQNEGFVQRDDIYDPGAAVKVACHEKCCVFHRWIHGSSRGYSLPNIRDEAKQLLGCGQNLEDVPEGEDRLVNGKASYGDNEYRHNLCIAGRSDDGEDCFAGLTKAELAAEKAEKDGT